MTSINPAMVKIFSSGRASSARFGFLIHALATASSPPTIASSERKSRTNSTPSSKGFVPRSSRKSLRRMRDTVASDTPSTADSDLAFTPSWSAARMTASVSTAASAAGLSPVFGSSIRISISGENIVQKSLQRKGRPHQRTTLRSILLIEHPALAGAFGHHREPRHTVAAGHLGPVERLVAFRIEVLGAFRLGGHAHAHRDRHRAVMRVGLRVDEGRLLDQQAYAIGDPEGC